MENLISFRYAELCEAKDRWYVYFYATNPATNKLERVRIHVNQQKTEALKKRLARNLITKINEKLDLGWNPFILEKEKKQYTNLVESLKYVMTYKDGYVRQRTKHAYTSNLKKLFNWIDQEKLSKMCVFEFDDNMAMRFMEYILLHEKIKGRTYNNLLMNFRSFFNTLINQKYISVNPFRSIQEMPEESKNKQPFSKEQLAKYVDYVKINDYDFYITSCYTYYCAIRPNEIVKLRIRDVELGKGIIHVPAGISKNRKDRVIPIAKVFLNELIAYYNEYETGMYICAKGFKPGYEKIYPTRIAEHFAALRPVLGLPKDIYFYSLKDTVAERLIESGFSVTDIRDLFGHSSVAITDNYMRKRNAHLNKRIKNDFPEI